MIYAIYVALVLVAFLVVLNGFFRGAKKAQIDAVLSLLLLGLVITAFFVAGWKLGLLGAVIAFLSGIIARPIAARLASRLFAGSTGGGGGYVGLPPRPLQKIFQQLGRPIDPNKLMEEMFSSGDRSVDAEDALLDYCEQQPLIQAILKEFQISRHDLQELYQQLLVAGAGQWTCGHWVAASALAYPEPLRYALIRKGEDITETAFKLIMYFEQGSALEA